LYAIGHEHEAVVKLLLEKGAKLESKDKDGWTPLLCAVENRHVAIVRLLLEKVSRYISMAHSESDNCDKNPMQF
jgi:ankyrin repeat protein